MRPGGLQDELRSPAIAALCLSARGPGRRSVPRGLGDSFRSPRSLQGTSLSVAAPPACAAACASALVATQTSLPSSEGRCKELQRQVKQLSEELRLCEAAMTACMSLKGHFTESEALYLKEAKLREAAQVGEKAALAESAALRDQVSQLRAQLAEMSLKMVYANGEASEARRLHKSGERELQGRLQNAEARIQQLEDESARKLQLSEQRFALDLQRVASDSTSLALRKAQEECTRLRASVEMERRISRSFHEDALASKAEAERIAAELEAANSRQESVPRLFARQLAAELDKRLTAEPKVAAAPHFQAPAAAQCVPRDGWPHGHSKATGMSPHVAQCQCNGGEYSSGQSRFEQSSGMSSASADLEGDVAHLRQRCIEIEQELVKLRDTQQASEALAAEVAVLRHQEHDAAKRALSLDACLSEVKDQLQDVTEQRNALEAGLREVTAGRWQEVEEWRQSCELRKHLANAVHSELAKEKQQHLPDMPAELPGH